MSNIKPPENLLLSALPEADRLRLLGDGAALTLEHAQVLQESGERIQHVYFPESGCISLLTDVPGQSPLEVGLVGNEGMLGVALLLGAEASPVRALVQARVTAYCVDASHLTGELAYSGALRDVLNRYLSVTFMQLTQAAACTRFHFVEARLARWLLMTRDRVQANRFRMTHEALAHVLGVRRVGVTRAASALQRRNLISYARGDLTIVDGSGLTAAACPCYTTDRETYTRLMG